LGERTSSCNVIFGAGCQMNCFPSTAFGESTDIG
jgi:hypothetical protein